MAVAPDRAAADCPATTCTGQEITTYSVRYHIIDVGDIGVVDPPFEPPSPWVPNPDTEGTLGLNELGAVVYAERAASSTYDPWVWLPHDMYGVSSGRHSLPSISHLSGSPANAIPREINDAGVIAGQSAASGSPLLSSGEPTFSPINGSATVWHLNSSMGSYQTFSSFGGQGAAASGATSISDTSPPFVTGIFLTSSDSHLCRCGSFQETQVNRGFGLTLGGNSVVFAPLDLDVSTHTEAWDVSFDSDYVVGQLTCGGGPGCLYPSCYLETCLSGGTLAPSQVYFPSYGESPGNLHSAYGVNNAGQSVGYVSSSHIASAETAFWNTPGACPCMLSLILPTNVFYARAIAVNNLQYPQVVGYGPGVGLLWEQQSDDSWLVTNLEKVIDEDVPEQWRNLRAHDINDKGWIAGVGTYCPSPPFCGPDDLEAHAFLLIPLDQMTEPCDGDADGDGEVDVFDLLAVLGNFGMLCEDPGPPLCIGDVAENGSVDVFDLLEVLNNFGECGSGTQTLEEALMAVGLPEDADDDYLNILQNGTQAQIDNYNCWVDHYLLECGVFCQHNCPDNDPWGRH